MQQFAAFRLANWDTPLWASPNRRSSRYLADGEGIVQYWSLHPLTPWAEYLRYHDIRRPDEVAELLIRPWVAWLAPPDMLLEISFDNAADHGIDPDALVDEDWSACQEWARTLDVDGLVVPSAALPGTRNLVLFGARVRVRWGVTPPDAELQVPCDPVADLASSLPDLLSCIRWRGEVHAGLEAWRRGKPEPLPPRVRVA